MGSLDPSNRPRHESAGSHDALAAISNCCVVLDIFGSGVVL